MSFQPHAIAAAKAIVSTHETFPVSARPNFACLATLKDGPAGGLQVTFGAHQATDRADSLDKIVARFRELAQEAYGEGWEGHTLADELAAYLPALAQNTVHSCGRLATDPVFLGLLRRSAAEPLMQRAQEEVFEQYYMKPAIAACEGSGFTEPLSLAVVYDSIIHGSFGKIRDLVAPGPERDWTTRYVARRRLEMQDAGVGSNVWHNPLLRNCTYRMQTFEKLIGAGNWGLVTPFVAHGITVTDEDVLAWLPS